MAEKSFMKYDWVVLLISAVSFIYYLLLQDFIETNMIVIVAWSLLNLALVYRVVASRVSHKKS